MQVGAKDSGRGEKKRSGECCSSVQVLHWSQTPWASPEAVCLTKILFTVSQRGCQAPISIMLPVAFCENEFHCAGDAPRCSPLPLCILLFFPSSCLFSCNLTFPSLLFRSLPLCSFWPFSPNRWIMSFSITPHQWFQEQSWLCCGCCWITLSV